MSPVLISKTDYFSILSTLLADALLRSYIVNCGVCEVSSYLDVLLLSELWPTCSKGAVKFRSWSAGF